MCRNHFMTGFMCDSNLLTVYFNARMMIINVGAEIKSNFIIMPLYIHVLVKHSKNFSDLEI